MGLTDWSISTDAIVGGVIALIILIFLIVNAIYWWHIVYEFENKSLVESAHTVSKSTAQALMILSIIGAIIVGLYMLYNGARWFYNTNLEDQKKAVVQTWQQTKKGVAANFPPKVDKPVPSLDPALVPVPVKEQPKKKDINMMNTKSNITVDEPKDPKDPKEDKKKTTIQKGCFDIMTPKYNSLQGKLECSGRNKNEADQKLLRIRPTGLKDNGRDVFEIEGIMPTTEGGGTKFTINSLIQPEIYDKKEPYGIRVNDLRADSNASNASTISSQDFSSGDLPPKENKNWIQRKVEGAINTVFPRRIPGNVVDEGGVNSLALGSSPDRSKDVNVPSLTSPPLSRSASPQGNYDPQKRSGLESMNQNPLFNPQPAQSNLGNQSGQSRTTSASAALSQPPASLMPPPPPDPRNPQTNEFLQNLRALRQQELINNRQVTFSPSTNTRTNIPPSSILNASSTTSPQELSQTQMPLGTRTGQPALFSPQPQLQPQTQLPTQSQLQPQLQPQTQLPTQSQLQPQLQPQTQLPTQSQLQPQSQSQLQPQLPTQLNTGFASVTGL